MKSLKILQYNAGHCRAATAELEQKLLSENIDVAIISEQYTSSVYGYNKIESGRAMILIKYGVQFRKLSSIGDTVVVEIGNVKIGSLYWSPNGDISGPLLDLEGVLQSNPNGKWLLGGDLNIGVAPWVESCTLNHRKKARTEKAEAALIALDLRICNNRDPTSCHQGRETVNDYTMAKETVVKNWRVLKEGELSGHRYILYELESVPYEIKEQVILNTNLEKYEELICDKMPKLLEYDSRSNTIENAMIITSWISEAIKNSTVETPLKRSSQWWTPEIGILKDKYCKAKIRYNRCKNTEIKALLKEEVSTIKKEYTRAIHAAKEATWRKFITQNQAWGKPYKLIVKPKRNYGVQPGLKYPNTDLITKTSYESEQLLLTSKFPTSDPSLLNWSIDDGNCSVGTDEVELVDHNEVSEFLKVRNNKTAPGMDGIRWKHLKILNKKCPKILVNLYNGCLRYSVFPAPWKEGWASFIPKPDKPLDDTNSYRPITLLSCLGKTLERLIKNRLPIKHNDHQYGFRKGRSAEDCINRVLHNVKSLQKEYPFVATISLDIHGAFDHLLHREVIKAMETRKVPRYVVSILKDYFSGRKVSTGAGTRSIDRGCPQGSVLGPLLWNIVYDAILEMLSEMGILAFAFADDTLLILPAYNKAKLLAKVNVATEAIIEKFVEFGLKLNCSKTEVVIFENIPRGIKCDPEWIIDSLKIGNDTVEPKEFMKYLGVMIDRRLTLRSTLITSPKRSGRSSTSLK